ncbi:MAG: arylsulfatase A-like enzyme, partial [Rhodothermales bacterium]
MKLLLFLFTLSAFAAPHPNILWLTSEDNGPHLGCYGDTYATTPNLDALAAKSLRYLNAWSNAPVCAPARTTIISGMYPPATGSEHMRSNTALPPGFKMYPQFLREAGYYCTNTSKEDYNLAKPGQVWDESGRKAHWKKRKPDQPFFAIFNYTISHESKLRTRPHTQVHDPAKVRVPAYHPDIPEVRQDWAQYHDRMTEMDSQAGRALRELEAAGLADNTIIFYYGDHGSGMPRSKRWPYNSGLHVPLIVHVPEAWRALAPQDYSVGGSTDRLVGFVDLAPTLLSICGIKPPDYFHGHAFMGKDAAPAQPFAYGFRGRMDERNDLVRVARDQRYIYIRNYNPHKIYGQYIDYMFQTPTTRRWRELYDAGALKPPQTFFWETKPAEELYDLQA